MAPRIATTSTLLSLSSAALALGGLSLLTASALLVLQSQSPTRAQTPAPACQLECALPEGVSLQELSAATADELALRSTLCADLACSRISRAQYETSLRELELRYLEPLPEQVWASEVLASSSEYTASSWSAAQVLGEPNAYPNGGDNSSAWASLAEDDKSEFIEVAVPAYRVQAVQVYETYNPGAIRSIDIRLASGVERRVFTGEPRVRSEQARVEEAGFACTDEKVVAVRVTLDSAAVPGWNEIDAIAVRPCR